MYYINCFQKTNIAWWFGVVQIQKKKNYKLIKLTLMGIYLQFVSNPSVIWIHYLAPSAWELGVAEHRSGRWGKGIRKGTVEPGNAVLCIYRVWLLADSRRNKIQTVS